MYGEGCKKVDGAKTLFSPRVWWPETLQVFFQVVVAGVFEGVRLKNRIPEPVKTRQKTFQPVKTRQKTVSTC
jgi:hypothetical protein